MTELVGLLSNWWWAALIAFVLLIAVIPGLVLRGVLCAYPKGHPRKRELLAELRAVPPKERVVWVLGQVETVWQEAPTERRRARGAEAEVSVHGQRGVLDIEIRSLLRRSIADLPEREKLVLSLCYDEGLTFTEIAEVLGITESRARQIHSKSVLYLRRQLLPEN